MEWRAGRVDDDLAPVAGANVEVIAGLMGNRLAMQDASQWPGVRREWPAFGVTRLETFAPLIRRESRFLRHRIITHQKAIGVIARAHTAVGVHDEHAICHGVESRLEERRA